MEKYVTRDEFKELLDNFNTLNSTVKKLCKVPSQIKPLSPIEIQSGTSDTKTTNWECTHDDYWSYKTKVNFDKEFSQIPKIFLSLTKIDQGDDKANKSYSNFDIFIIDNTLSTKGFELCVKTMWTEKDCRIDEMRVDWLAYLKK